MGDDDKKNCCATCGVRTHKGAMKLKNSDVHYGVCIKCNPKDVPPSVLKNWKQKQSPGASDATKRVSIKGEEGEKPTEKSASRPTVATSNSKNMTASQRSMNDEEKSNHCSTCGVRTHRGPKFARIDLKNVEVHYGVCVKCNPKDVPPSVLKAFKDKDGVAPAKPVETKSKSSVTKAEGTKPAAAATAGAVAASSASSRSVAASSRSLVSDEDKSNHCHSCGVRTHRGPKFSRVELKNEDVHYGICIKCNRKGVPPSVLKGWKETHEEEANDEADSATGSAAMTASSRASKDSNHCQSCGVRTHKGPKFARVELKNDDVHYGVCIKCNRSSVPPSVLKSWKEVRDSEVANAPKMPAASSSRSLNEDYKSNHCESCGLRTHKGPKFSRIELKNDDIHYGVCIKCNPNSVPPTILKAWKESHASDAKETKSNINKPAVAAAAVGGAAAGAAVGSVAGSAMKKQSSVRRKSMEKELVEELDVAWSQAREYVVKSKQDLGIEAKAELDTDQEAKVKAKAKEIHSKNPEPKRLSASSRSLGATAKSVEAANSKNSAVPVGATVGAVTAAASSSRSMTASQRSLNEEEKSNHCDSCGVRTHRGPKFARVELKNSDVHYGVCVKCHPNDVPPAALKAFQEKGPATASSRNLVAEEDSANHCSSCGIRTHKGPKLNPVELKNDDVYYGICIKCNRKGVPPSVLKAWKELNEEEAGAVDSIAMTASGREVKVESNHCQSCGVRTHRGPKFARVELKNEDVHYGKCIKCNRNDVPPSVLKSWKELRSSEAGDAPMMPANSSSRNLNEEYKSNHCHGCGIRTHRGPKFARAELKNAEVHYGICIKCNPRAVPPQVVTAFKEKKDIGGVSDPSKEDPENFCPTCGVRTHTGNSLHRDPLKNDKVHYGKCIKCNTSGAESEDGISTGAALAAGVGGAAAGAATGAAIASSASRGRAGLMIEEERRAEEVKKGLCPDCGVKTHNVGWFNRDPLKNAEVHYGVCIGCNPKDVPPGVLEAFAETHSSRDHPSMVGTPSASEREVSEAKTPDTGYLARTFDIPEDVTQWLEANLSKGDLSAVILSSASGKPISSYMKTSSSHRRRKKSSSHRSSSEDVAALRKEMSEMRKAMKKLADNVDTSGGVES